jgi:neural Wiskott-Aldrich syndrome protein
LWFKLDIADTASVCYSSSFAAIMISQAINTKHEHSPAAFVPGLLPNSYSILASASARVYHAQLRPKNAEWCYSRLRGTLVLGKDSNAVHIEDPLRPNNSIVEAESHWFRLLDAESGKPVWMFKFYPGFSYQLDRPFFHVVQGRVSCASIDSGLFVNVVFPKSRKFGFLFDDDDEAGAFARKVTGQGCPPRMSFQKCH